MTTPFHSPQNNGGNIPVMEIVEKDYNGSESLMLTLNNSDNKTRCASRMTIKVI